KIKKYKKIILDGISKKIEYTSDFNYDMLENMCISHDTLLEYCYQLFKRNDIVKQLLFDSYPIIFIDEYQDTSQLRLELFVIKDDSEGGEFYYLGPLRYVENSASEMMKNGDSVVQMLFKLDSPVETNLYKYLTNQ
ncbi:TPA: DUF3427 domain-containing protein, partial [Streptococcus suis]